MPDGHGEGIDLVARAEAKQTPGRGRGVFAVTAFKVGDEIDFLGNKLYSGKFYDADVYRDFLLALPQHLACEVARWSYTQYDEDSDKPHIGLDLSIASLLNHSDEPNVGDGGVVVKDISPGDEILTDYTRYEAYAWDLMGLGNWEGQMMGVKHSKPQRYKGDFDVRASSSDDDGTSSDDDLNEDWKIDNLYELRQCHHVLYGLGGEKAFFSSLSLSRR